MGSSTLMALREPLWSPCLRVGPSAAYSASPLVGEAHSCAERIMYNVVILVSTFRKFP